VALSSALQVAISFTYILDTNTLYLTVLDYLEIKHVHEVLLLVKYAGCEALFADLGHFTVRSIQISMCYLTYPAIVLAYTGQAAFLRKNNELVGSVFYSSIPSTAMHFLCYSLFCFGV